MGAASGRQGGTVDPTNLAAPVLGQWIHLALVRGAEQDESPATVRLPAGFDGLREQSVGLHDPPPEQFSGLVLRRLGCGIPPGPEAMDEGKALLVGAELAHRLAFHARQQVAHRSCVPLRQG